MTALYIAAGVLALIGLLLLLRLRLIAEYDARGFVAFVRIGPWRGQIAGEKKKAKKKGKEKEEKKKEDGRKKGTFEDFKATLPEITDVVRRLFRHLVIEDLVLHYVAAGGENPAAAALQFGGAYAGIGVLLPILESVFTIKRRDLQAEVDFNATESTLYAKAHLSLALWKVLAGFVRLTVKSMKRRKTEPQRKGGRVHG